jgi:hypothetical protein
MFGLNKVTPTKEYYEEEEFHNVNIIYDPPDFLNNSKKLKLKKKQEQEQEQQEQQEQEQQEQEQQEHQEQEQQEQQEQEQRITKNRKQPKRTRHRIKWAFLLKFINCLKC